MKYIYIRNKGSLEDRRLLEIVGVSTKRKDDASQRGHKGSGKKLAAIAALRAGVNTAVTSWDERGSFFLDYATEPLKMAGTQTDRIIFHYWMPDPEGREELAQEISSSSWCLQAFPDWDKPVGHDMMKLFKPLREHIIDAADADPDFEWGVSDNRFFAQEGETVVFMEYDETLDLMLKEPACYFKFLSDEKPLAEVKDRGEIWRKSEPGFTRLFLQGVLLDCDSTPQRTTLFDYSLNDKGLLTEERTLKSAASFEYKLGLLFARLKDLGLCRQILRAAAEGRAEIEKAALGTMVLMTDGAKKTWREAVTLEFGGKIALATSSEVANIDAKQLYGYEVLTLTGGLRSFLETLGVPTTDDVFPKGVDKHSLTVPFEQFDAESRRNFLTAFRTFSTLFPERVGYPIFFFVALSEAMKRMGGHSGENEQCFKQVWIQALSVTQLPGVTELLYGLIHETRHCHTRKYDHERGFGAQADIDVMRMIDVIQSLAGKALRSLATEVPVEPVFGVITAKAAVPLLTLDDIEAQKEALKAEERLTLQAQSDAMLERVSRHLDMLWDSDHPDSKR